MRWKANPQPKIGDKREVYKFAWFPTLVGDQVVWLERYCIEQEYKTVARYHSDSDVPVYSNGWEEIRRSTLEYYY